MKNPSGRLIMSLLTLAVTGLMVSSGNLLVAQNYEWELDKVKKRELAKKRELDSLMVHYKNHWQLSLSYGQHYFNNSGRPKEKSVLDFPDNIGTWNLSAARYLSEHLSAHVNAGILLKKIVPPNPDIISILAGAEVEIEGGGIMFMPAGAGMNYFFMKKRFRPYAGCSIGLIPARYKYVEISGNLSNGINKNEYIFKSKAPFVELSSGFVYRAGKNVQVGLNCGYSQSKDFKENMGGYEAYNGLKISVVLSVIF